MRLSDIQKKAQGMSIKDTWKYSKKELIRTIQKKEGNYDCFGTSKDYCDQEDCCWRTDCVK